MRREAKTMRIEPAIPIDLEATPVDRVYHPVGVWQEAPGADVPALAARRLHRRIGRGGGLFPHPPRAAEPAIRRERSGPTIDRAVGLGDSSRARRAAQRRRALGIRHRRDVDGMRDLTHPDAERIFEAPAGQPAHKR